MTGRIARRHHRLWLALGGVLLLFGVYILVASTLPLRAYEVHGYVAIPDRACVGQAVQLDVDRTLREPPLGSVGSWTLETYWESVDGLRRTPVETFTGDFAGQPRGRHVVTSVALRTTPLEPGQWRLVSTIRYRWRILGWPRNDGYQTFTSDTILTTIEGERCTTSSTR